nr:hypothetical protein [Mycolicibacterium rhodesiae]
MSESPTPSELATAPVATAAPVVRDEPRRSRATLAAAWVGVVAGVVFIVAVIFFSGFILGAHSGGHRGPGGHMGDRDFVEFHRGPPPMFGIPPDGQFDRPGPGPGGPRFGPPPGPPSSPSGPQSPGATPTPPRP